ncbi:uncharacterized protein LOC142987149 [Anticarsia gemmatalis]|uniref:uncharacterized protein LOC142987149 n=1 Tax=Anticarsia gemmatalis TaxID=129554 RepID=UPI003F76DACC
MSKKDMSDGDLQDVRVEVPSEEYERKLRRKSKQRSSEFVYVNNAYVGSLTSVNEPVQEPPTSVIREQYWACSKWPLGQRILAIAVGVLLGAVIGLAISMALKTGPGAEIFKASAPD